MTCNSIWFKKIHFRGCWGHLDVKWPTNGLKHSQVNIWYNYFSFDFSLDKVQEFFSLKVLKVIWRPFGSQMTSKWSKTSLGQLLASLPFIWYATQYGSRIFQFGGCGGHLEVKWPPNGLKHPQVNYWYHYLSFDMSLDIVQEIFILKVMKVIWGSNDLQTV